jgi:hypothetical protein
MLLVTHSLVGGALASKITNPFLALPLILIGHFLSDFTPHWDIGVVYKKLGKIKTFLFSCLDGMGGLFLVFLFFQFQKPFSPLLWLGTFISLLPDFLQFPFIFLNFNLFPWLDRLHGEILHRQNENVFWGLVPQLIIIGLCWLVR